MKLEKTDLLKEKERLEKENKEFRARWKDTNVIIRNDETLVMNTNTFDYLKELEDRIDKAIEYINGLNHFELDCNKPFRKVSKYEEAYIKREKELLDILKGE